MKRNKRERYKLSFEKLDNKVLLSVNPWYVEAIKVEPVWSYLSTSATTSKPVVAIIDSGIDLNHVDLKDNVWVNPFDQLDGIDNDNNGYIDDINGWNFVNNNNVPQDGYFHGTHVAGIVDGVSNNNVVILPLKFMDDKGVGFTDDAIKGINYAVDMKLRGVNLVAINCSFGGTTGYSSLLYDALKRASDNDIMVVTGAGNNSSDNDVIARYPSGYDIVNNISVAATNSDNSLAGYSNYGKNSVSVAAPGTSIYSTLPGNNYGYVSGTSMSTPMISGAVALLRSFGNYTMNQIKSSITQGCDVLNSLIDKVKCGLLNVSHSFEILTGIKLSTSVVNQAGNTVNILPVTSELNYKVETVNNKIVKGWSFITNSDKKPIIQVYINNRLRYSVLSKGYRNDIYNHNGFKVILNRRFLNLRNNVIEIRIKDPVNNNIVVAYRDSIKR